MKKIFLILMITLLASTAFSKTYTFSLNESSFKDIKRNLSENFKSFNFIMNTKGVDTYGASLTAKCSMVSKTIAEVNSIKQLLSYLKVEENDIDRLIDSTGYDRVALEAMQSYELKCMLGRAQLKN